MLLKQDEKRFVFFEKSGKRWKYSKMVVGSALIFAIIFLYFIAKGLVNTPMMAADLNMYHGNIEPINNPVSHPGISDGKEFSLDSITVTGQEQTPKVFTFYQTEKYSNMEHRTTLEENIESIDILVPDWLYFDKEGKVIDKADSKIDALAEENNVQILPSITLDENSTADDLHNWLANPQTQKQMIQNLLRVVKSKNYQGLHLYLDDIHWEDKDLYNQFVTDLYDVFHQSGLLLTSFVRLGDDTYDTKLLSEVSDHIMVKIFDQHIESDEPGPLASFQWTEERIGQYEGSMEKLVPMLANYGYDWNMTTDEPAAPYDFSAIMEMVNREDLKVQWDDQYLTPYVRYKDGNDEHVIWLLDAATSYNQIKLVQSHDIPSIGVWNVGSEDPSLWKYLSGGTINSAALETIPNRTSTAIAGEGDFLKVTNRETEGARSIELDKHLVKRAIYKKYPSPYLLEKYGTEEKKVAISFDDGPDPKYTGEILDILNQHSVKAAFFLIGQNASLNPELTKRIYEEGHELGSHTFTHKDIMSMSKQELEFELNSTQRVIQGITGHSALMFRPPFLLMNDEPDELPTPNVYERFLDIQDMGYTVVSSSIDPQDWSGKTAEQIVSDTTKNVENGRILLLHDSGGDRNPTLEALPQIIEWLQNNGYEIVPVSELVGIERAAAMPPVQAAEEAMVPLYSYGSSFTAVLYRTLKHFLTLLIAIGIGRLAVLLFFSFKQKRRSEQEVLDDSYQPFVSVLIAAYNEETVINNTIQSILKSRYPQFELLIIDDGSTDRTADIVEEESKKHAHVRLFKKENGGKSSALNIGFHEAQAEIIVTLDADTLIAEDTLSKIVKYFTDPKVGAVSGNVKIGNRKNLLTWWQHIEYVTGYNLEKRAFDELDSITVVPGAIGAWRKSALIEVDLFEEDTLAEDTDATMKLLRKGYTIRSEADAIAYTEAPEDVRSFVKQRYRWTFGILQCLYKHRKALFNRENKKLGFIAMPNMLFQYVLLATAPLADVIFIVALMSGNTFVAYFYLVFLLLDSLVSVYAFGLEKENKKPLLTLFIQRIIYRQFFTFVVWKSFVYAIKGQLQGWNKLKRTGNATQTEAEEVHTTV